MKNVKLIKPPDGYEILVMQVGKNEYRIVAICKDNPVKTFYMWKGDAWYECTI